MPIAILFWVIFVIWVLFGAWQHGTNWKAHGPNLILIVLIGLLGWRVFGPILHQ
jgi:hypothetical protein